MIALLLKISLSAAIHISLGYLFYVIRINHPTGLMKWDLVAFGLPLLTGFTAYFCLLFFHEVTGSLTFAWRFIIVLIISAVLGCVSQVIAMTIGANRYGS